jgi:hypothetical protein
MLIRDANGTSLTLNNRGDGNATPITIYHCELPSTATPIAAATGGIQGVAAAAGLALVGFSILETAGSTAGVKIHHGTDNTGPLLDIPQALTANQALRVWFGNAGPSCPNGVYIERTSGTTQLVLFTTAG